MVNRRASFSVELVGGFGLPLVGRYYWTRRRPDPEPIHSHGPFLFACRARRDARRQLGRDAIELTAQGVVHSNA